MKRVTVNYIQRKIDSERKKEREILPTTTIDSEESKVLMLFLCFFNFFLAFLPPFFCDFFLFFWLFFLGLSLRGVCLFGVFVVCVSLGIYLYLFMYLRALPSVRSQSLCMSVIVIILSLLNCGYVCQRWWNIVVYSYLTKPWMYKNLHHIGKRVCNVVWNPGCLSLRSLVPCSCSL